MLPRRRLGRSGSTIGAIGYGTAHWCLQPICASADAHALVRGVVDLGITLIDTADAYYTPPDAAHDVERHLADALEPAQRDTLIVATKGGAVRPDGRWGIDGRPAHLARTIRDSVDALGPDRPIDLWQLHAVDPRVDLRAQLAPVAAAAAEGLIRHVGLSNVSVPEIERAREVVDIVSVQNQFSLFHRRPEWDGTLAYCEREGLTFFCWGPLGGPGRLRRECPPGLAVVAAERGVTPACLAVAWLLAKSDRLVPLVGSRTLAHVAEILPASSLSLSADDVHRIQQASPAPV